MSMTEQSSIAASPAPGLAGQLAIFAGDIKISHTIFALPWAILSTFLASRMTGAPLTALKIVLIVICMVTARTVAMAANRLLDARLDALNPRTARRAIPSGQLSSRFVMVILVLCSAGFFGACYGFLHFYANRWPISLSLPVLLFVSAYPLLKRFTRLCHYYLGAALALAPVCAWLAISGGIAWPPAIMAAAVLLWTAGFDIIYACQDYQSDVQTGVFSVPAKIGISAALWVARLSHVACAGMLVLLGIVAWPALSSLYATGAGIAILLLVVEHALVRADDLSKVGLAFFTINGIISLIVGTLGVLDVVRGSS